MKRNPTKVVLASTLALLAAELLGACAKDRAETVPAQPVTAKATCPATPESPVPAADSVSGVGSQPLAPPQPPPPTFQGRLLLPPTTPGESKFELTGCLSLANPTEAEAARFPPPPATRGPASPAVRVNPMARGAIVVHELSHACCLKADVTTRLDGAQLVVLEQLSGSPCRCMCASTLRTAVGLSPGHYTLSLHLAQGGNASVVRELPFAVENVTP